MKTYLVPTDFSAEAALALAVALAMAARGDRVVLFHAFSFVLSPEVLSPAKIQQIQGRVDDGLAESKRRARAIAPNVFVDTESRTGDAAVAILDWVGHRRPDAIVMGTHGRGRIASALVGSVAQHVLHDARPLVIVVRPGASS